MQLQTQFCPKEKRDSIEICKPSNNINRDEEQAATKALRHYQNCYINNYLSWSNNFPGILQYIAHFDAMMTVKALTLV